MAMLHCATFSLPSLFSLFLVSTFHSCSIVSCISDPTIFFPIFFFTNFFISFFKFFLIFVVSIQFSSFISLASFEIALHFPEFLPFFLSFFLLQFPFFFLSSSSSYPNYTIVMISSIFLDISLLFSCCCFSFLFSFFFHFRSSDLFPIFQFSLSFFFTFFLISVVSISVQLNSSFISFTITMLFLFLCKFLNFYLFFFLFSSSFLPLFFLLPPSSFFFISQCDDFLNFPCHFLGALLPAPAFYPSLPLCFMSIIHLLLMIWLFLYLTSHIYVDI